MAGVGPRDQRYQYLDTPVRYLICTVMHSVQLGVKQVYTTHFLPIPTKNVLKMYVNLIIESVYIPWKHGMMLSSIPGALSGWCWCAVGALFCSKCAMGYLQQAHLSKY